jgi:hypothetical protein
MAGNPVTKVLLPIFRVFAKIDRATKRLGARLGITKETVPDRLLWPFRRIAYGIVMAGSKLDSGARRVWSTVTGGGGR